MHKGGSRASTNIMLIGIESLPDITEDYANCFPLQIRYIVPDIESILSKLKDMTAIFNIVDPLKTR